MCCDRKIIVLHDQIIYWRDPQIELQRLPVGSVIETDIDAALSSSVEQTFVRGINTNGVNVVVFGNSVHDGGPGLPVIRRLKNVWGEVVHLVPFDRDIRGCGFTWGSFNHADRAPRRHTLGREVLPLAAPTARKVGK